jgi:pimeloyl-ACP methyl ester carboxylesterase
VKKDQQKHMEIIAWLIAVYVAFCLLALFGHRWFMYFPDATRVAPAAAGLDGIEEVEIAAEDGTTLVAWYAPAKDGKPTLLYFHGNGANAANRTPRIRTIQDDGFGVFYLNNRGYGGSGGTPTEEHNVADARAAYDHLIGLGAPADSIVLYGESLGSGQAVRLAAEKPVAAVVLEAPLTSTIDVARPIYFWLPLGLLITDQYNVERAIGSVTVPLLILHGAQDAVIPVDLGQRVYRAANEPKHIEVFPQGGHLDFFDHGAWEKTRAFLAPWGHGSTQQ